MPISFVRNSLNEIALFHGSREPVGSIFFSGSDFDATIEEGDLLVACITSSGDAGTYSVSSPWFQVVDGTRSAMWAKWAGVDEASSAYAVSTPSGQEVAVLAFILRGVNPTGTVLATGTNIRMFAQGGVNGSLSSPALQTSETGAVYVVSGGSSTVTVIDETSGDITDFVRYRNHSGGDGRPTYLGAAFNIAPNVDYTRTISFPSSTNSSGEVLAAVFLPLPEPEPGDTSTFSAAIAPPSFTGTNQAASTHRLDSPIASPGFTGDVAIAAQNSFSGAVASPSFSGVVRAAASSRLDAGVTSPGFSGSAAISSSSRLDAAVSLPGFNGDVAIASSNRADLPVSSPGGRFIILDAPQADSAVFNGAVLSPSFSGLVQARASVNFSGAIAPASFAGDVAIASSSNASLPVDSPGGRFILTQPTGQDAAIFSGAVVLASFSGSVAIASINRVILPGVVPGFDARAKVGVQAIASPSVSLGSFQGVGSVRVGAVVFSAIAVSVGFTPFTPLEDLLMFAPARFNLDGKFAIPVNGTYKATFQLKQPSGAIIDLTGVTNLTFKLWRTRAEETAVTGTATVVDAPNGKIRLIIPYETTTTMAPETWHFEILGDYPDADTGRTEKWKIGIGEAIAVR